MSPDTLKRLPGVRLGLRRPRSHTGGVAVGARRADHRRLVGRVLAERVPLATWKSTSGMAPPAGSTCSRRGISTQNPMVQRVPLLNVVGFDQTTQRYISTV